MTAEGCDDIFDPGKAITVGDQACGTGGMLSTAYSYIRRYNPPANVRLFGQEFMGHLYAVGLAGGGDSQLLFMQSAVEKMDDTAKKPQLLKKYY